MIVTFLRSHSINISSECLNAKVDSCIRDFLFENFSSHFCFILLATIYE